MKPHVRIDGDRSVFELSATRIVLATAVGALLAVFGNHVFALTCPTFGPVACVMPNGTNPCTYFSCRQVNDTCVNGQGQVVTMWTKVIMPPQKWPRCRQLAPGFYTSTCDEGPAVIGDN